MTHRQHRTTTTNTKAACLYLTAVSIILLFNVLPLAIRFVYKSHGHGDQLLAFAVVFTSLISPILFPILQLKNFILLVLLPSLGLEHLEGQLMYAGGRWMLTPATSFQQEIPPPAPQYEDLDMWSMHPEKPHDASRSLPRDSGLGKECVLSRSNDGGGGIIDVCNSCTAFYLHPSTWYTGASWNAPALHAVTSYLSDDAIGPQQATAFNSACRIFAPRFRQMAAGGFLQLDGLKDVNSRAALDLAFSDVDRAMQHFLTHYHKGEPIFLVGHSQGSVLGKMLVQKYATRGSQFMQSLAAAYLVGWTVFDTDVTIPPCVTANDTGCVISWRTFARGGDPKAFLHVEPPLPNSRRICVNPLTWEGGLNTSYAPHSMNKGGLDLMHYYTMWKYLIGFTTPQERVVPPPIIPGISDAQCVDGQLWVEQPSHFGYGMGPWPAYTFATFPGRNLHTYDFNLFFVNVRENVVQRVRSWYKEKNGGKVLVVG